MTTPAFDVLTMGRVSVDLYPEQSGVSLAEVRTFAKSLGGSPTNVAVAAARLGRKAAVITQVGIDGFGAYVRECAARLRRGRPVRRDRSRAADARWCSASCIRRITSRCSSTVSPPRPDIRLRLEQLDLDAIQRARVFWTTGTGPVRRAEPHGDAGRPGGPRAPGHHDPRPRLSPLALARTRLGRRVSALRPQARHRRDREPRGGVRCGWRGRARDGRPPAAEPRPRARDREARRAAVWSWPGASETVRVEPVAVEVVNGLGAGDAFGGAVCHGLLAGWDPCAWCGSRRRPAPTWPRRLACADAMPTEAEVLRLLETAERPLAEKNS